MFHRADKRRLRRERIMIGIRRGTAGALALAAATLIAGCSEEELFGTGQGARAEASTPGGIQEGNVSVGFTLEHSEITSADVRVSYSTNGGLSFNDATAGPGGSGTEGLSVSPGGTAHTFVWDSGADLGGMRADDVRVRISPKAGKSGTTDAFPVHNKVFLAAAHTTETAEVSLYELDLVDGSIAFLGLARPGGETPWDVVHREGIFYVANTGTGNVSALALDEEAGTLTPLEGSPYSTGGVGPKYLALGSTRLFASNASGGTISVFDIAEDGALARRSASGVTLSGCRSLAVRGAQLYVARESPPEIAIFDIEEDGDLVVNPYSPVSAAGLVSPRAVARLGSYLYAANFDAATICGFRFLAGGDLLEIAGSPFSFTDAGVEGIRAHGTARLFLAGGAAESFTHLLADDTGIATEAAGSPVGAAGPVRSVVSAGKVLVAGTTAKTLEVYVIEDDDSLAAAESSPFATSAGISRMALSD